MCLHVSVTRQAGAPFSGGLECDAHSAPVRERGATARYSTETKSYRPAGPAMQSRRRHPLKTVAAKAAPAAHDKLLLLRLRYSMSEGSRAILKDNTE